MYTPAHFRIDDPDECFDIVERRAAGTLVVSTGLGFEASLLPWVVQRMGDGRGLLQGHVSKANPLAVLAAEAVPALVIFDLVDGYVSPSWYPSKAEHHQVVPTWNYVSVHVHGTVRVVDQPHWLREQIEMLTEEHEADMKAPWSVHDAPDEFIAKMMKGIIGLEFHVERLEGKVKLSQNRSAADRAGVIAGLNAVGDDPLWAAMQEWGHDEGGVA